MSAPIRLRPFHPADVPALFTLFRDTVHRVNSRDYSPEQVRAWAPDEINPTRWATLADRFAVVVEIGGQPVGFADLEPDGHIDRFFVHADHQGCGIGGTIMHALVAEAARTGLTRLFAEVSITARPFFERHGFVVLVEQQVVIRGVALTNFRMERNLI
ncbi:acetyltransferase : Glr3142 protein OS=Gloeobacter violaceus (strain PCC 7421) GN=glr3142 PE=4 SV=1: Acetyltransf_10 [Gemmata massiliana]|uniref:N-acetyltransferase domain-containing protein n=1 Tax=Gemmata massiliana TaxID=1210884 RepID=A0A6P2CYP7_9BACT|nr:GNAT family N-acetyltransferase [Gemmata massiliana]VTR94258.1 acetyltransferase : Glr3142 protein OS=Gloeobacter violaceus (strain PCC 7421) GN=glr3142 PE=4 SV=1: Acetyltransf_10 [Gemmata massiliana]